MNKEDKLLNGIMAGLAGCVVKDLLTIFLKIFNLHPTFWDYGEYLVFQKTGGSVSDQLVGILMEFFFGIVFAVIFTHLKHLIQTNHPLIRGFVFGMMVWFGTRCLITLAQVKILTPHNLFMIPANIVIGGLYGLAVSYVLEKLEKRNKNNG